MSGACSEDWLDRLAGDMGDVKATLLIEERLQHVASDVVVTAIETTLTASCRISPPRQH